MESGRLVFVNHMMKEHGIEVNGADIVSETVTIFHDELGPNVFPIKYSGTWEQVEITEKV